MKLSTPLKTATVIAGMKQRELAAAAGVHESVISDLCKGRRNPNEDLADRLGRILGRRPQDLFPRGTV